MGGAGLVGAGSHGGFLILLQIPLRFYHPLLGSSYGHISHIFCVMTSISISWESPDSSKYTKCSLWYCNLKRKDPAEHQSLGREPSRILSSTISGWAGKWKSKWSSERKPGDRINGKEERQMGQSHTVEFKETIPTYYMVLVDGLHLEEKGLRKQTQNSCQSCPIYVICCLINSYWNLKQIWKCNKLELASFLIEKNSG